MPDSHIRRRSVSLTIVLLIALVAQVLPMIGGVAPLAPQPVGAAVDAGYQGPSMSGASAPTGQKPQSKLWFNDGAWWGALWSKTAGKFTIWRFNWDANTWADTGTVIDSRSRSSADALWTGTNLFVGTAVKETIKTGDLSARVLRYSYNSSAKTYSLDAGFPVTIANGGIEALVIDEDSLDRVWATWTQANGAGGRQVMMTRSSIGGSSFIAPFVLPVSNAANLDADDISTLVAYDTNKIGVLWSNQNTSEVYWASHDDGAADGAWTVEAPLSGPGYADDHLNIKALQADASGRVFAAVKTSLNDIYPSTSQQPLILLLVLDGPGSWRRYTFSRVVENQTRPIVLVSPENRQLFMFAAGPCCSGGVVYSKQTSLDRPSFATGQGDPFISLSSNPTINNPTSTKQPLTLESGVLVIAGDDHTHNYVFNKVAFTPGPIAPETTITSGPPAATTSSSASFTFTSSITGSTFECALDAGGFSSCTSPHSLSGLADASHTFQVRATAAGVTDPTPASRTWTVDSVPPTVVSTVPAADATGVASTPVVTATFSEPMDAATISTSTFSLTPAGGSAIGASVSYDVATQTARLTPSAALAASTTYTARVASGSGGVRDLAGNAMAVDVAWLFTTSADPPPPSGTVTRQATATTVNTTATNSVSVVAPAGTVAGDVLVSCLVLNGGLVATSGVPAGWQPIAAVTSIANPRVFGYYKVVGSSEPASYTWGLTSSVASSAGIARYSGVDPAQPLDGTPSSGTGPSSTSATLGGIATSAANAMLVGCVGVNSGSTSVQITAPTGMSEAWNLGGKRQELADETLAIAGASGTRTWTFSSSREWAGWLVALRPG